MPYAKWADIRRTKDPYGAARKMIAHGERPLYRYTVEPDGAWLFVKVPELDGAHAQVDRPIDAADSIRETIALLLGVPEAAFDVELDETPR